MSFIGLDLGSTSIKAALLDPAAGTISHIRGRPFPDPVRGQPALWFEIDPEPVIAHVRDLIAELVDLSPTPCTGLLGCSQMGGVILVSPDGQQHRTNYLSCAISASSNLTPVATARISKSCSAEPRKTT